MEILKTEGLKKYYGNMNQKDKGAGRSGSFGGKWRIRGGRGDFRQRQVYASAHDGRIGQTDGGQGGSGWERYLFPDG